MRRYSLVDGRGRIAVEGQIGALMVSAASVRRSLAETAGPVSVVIDTIGGCCAEGLAIYTALRECGRPVEVTIRRAFSMGAVIAAAGHRVAIDPGGAIGLHDSRIPRVTSPDDASPPYATAAALRRLARGLWSATVTHDEARRTDNVARFAEAADATHLDILTRRTGLTRGRLAELRAAETILNAERAVALGFADRIVTPEP